MPGGAYEDDEPNGFMSGNGFVGHLASSRVNRGLA
jgi:hypothetical protein